MTATKDLARAMSRIGARRLLHAALNWENFTKSVEVPGAVTPSVARETLTRDSRRRWELARIARRGDNTTRAFRLAKHIAGLA